MSDRTQTPSRYGHVWRWNDEDPEAIVILVLLIAAILFLPWKGCGPLSAQGGPHPVAEVARPQVEQLAAWEASKAKQKPVLAAPEAPAEPTPAEPPPAEPEAVDPHAGHNHP